MASLMAMPHVVVNLGGEMMYVLNQRLDAQSIPKDKARQVLDEVIGAMFNESFMEELFKPKPIYSFHSTKLIFQKLAHCSIMKLNETSMAKLYDLMTMVFKFQVLSTRSPRDIIDISLKHVANLREMVSESLYETLDGCSARIRSTYQSFSSGQLWSLRQTLLDFLQGRNVKISLLLQENFQSKSGKFIVDLDGPCARETSVPGKVRYFDAESTITRELAVDLGVLEAAHPIEYDEESYRESKALLGANLYAMFRGGASAKPEASNQADDAPHAGDAAQGDDEAEAKSSAEQKAVNGADEMNILADLIVPSSSARSQKAPRFRLNLFGAANEDFGVEPLNRHAGASSHRPSAEAKHFDHGPTVKFDAKATHRSLSERMKDLDMDVTSEKELYGGRRLEQGSSKTADSADEASDGDDDDLLDLMDQAAVGASHK